MVNLAIKNKTATPVINQSIIANRTRLVDQKTLDDYLAFFTTPQGAYILPYVYLESSEHYDHLVQRNSDYYLISNEVKIIAQNKHKLSKYLLIGRL